MCNLSRHHAAILAHIRSLLVCTRLLPSVHGARWHGHVVVASVEWLMLVHLTVSIVLIIISIRAVHVDIVLVRRILGDRGCILIRVLSRRLHAILVGPHALVPVTPYAQRCIPRRSRRGIRVCRSRRIGIIGGSTRESRLLRSRQRRWCWRIATLARCATHRRYEARRLFHWP